MQLKLVTRIIMSKDMTMQLKLVTRIIMSKDMKHHERCN